MVVVVVVFGRGAIGVLLVAQSVVVRETLERWLDSHLPEAELSLLPLILRKRNEYHNDAVQT